MRVAPWGEPRRNDPEIAAIGSTTNDLTRKTRRSVALSASGTHGIAAGFVERSGVGEDASEIGDAMPAATESASL